jgi:hypothetical protein
MTVSAIVRLPLKKGEVWDRGPFEFVQLPVAGDIFTIKECGGSEDDVRVLYAQHIPVRIGEADQPSAPSAILVVEWLTGRAD